MIEMGNPDKDRLAQCLFSEGREVLEFRTNTGKLEIILSSIQREEGSGKMFILKGHTAGDNLKVRILYNVETQKGKGPVEYL